MTLPPPIQALVDRVLAWGPVDLLRRVLDRYGRAGGGLLAGGLTYSALFALLPTLLLLTGILGFLVDDADRRRAIVESIAQSLPPLRGFIDASLQSITDGAAAAGTLGLVGLAWGASRFYGSLDDAFARIFDAAPRRGFVATTIRGILSVVLLISVFLAALVLTGIASFLAEQTASRLGGSTRTFWGVVTPLLTLLVFVVGMGAIYRVVPTRRVPLATLLLPAVVVGVALTVLTQLFSYVAPRLIGAAAVYGTFVAIFAAMVWLSLGFQVLLIGACWLRERLGPMPPPFVEELA
jgi:membrane protein